MKKNFLRILPAVMLTPVLLTGCFRIASPESQTGQPQNTTIYNPYTTQPDTSDYVPSTTLAQAEITTQEATTAEPFTIVPFTLPQEQETVPPQTEAPSVTQPQPTQPDYTSYSKAQVLSLYADALKKTRAYTGDITVHHKEGFTGDVVEASPGGNLTKQLAGYIIGAVTKPTESDYVFSGGKAVNEDKETIPLLLPQRTDFALTPEGVSKASVSENNGYLTVNMTLVSESVSMGETPKYNASAIGFLDTSSISFKVVTINSCTITYTGSTISAVIRPDGYIQSCSYVINMSTTGEVSGFGITGSGTIAGAQSEDWTLNW